MLAEYLDAEGFNHNKLLYCTDDIQIMFGVSNRTVLNWISDGTLDANKIKKSYYITRKNLESFFSTHFDKLDTEKGDE